jgi:hypothetical protein
LCVVSVSYKLLCNITALNLHYIFHFSLVHFHSIKRVKVNKARIVNVQKKLLLIIMGINKMSSTSKITNSKASKKN